MSDQFITTFAQLEQRLLRASSPERRLAMCLEFLDQPILIDAREMIPVATETVAYANQVNDIWAQGEGQYHMGLAYLGRSERAEMEIRGELIDPLEVDRGIAELQLAFSAFQSAKLHTIEESRARLEKLKRSRDKARPKRTASDAEEDAIKALRSSRVVSAALGLGWAYSRKGAFADALTWYRSALSQCDVTRSNALLAAAYEGLGSTLRVVGNSEEALKHLRKAVSIRRELRDVERTAAALAALAATYRQMEDSDAAYEYYCESLALYAEACARHRMLGATADEIGCRYRESVIRVSLAEIQIDRHEPDAALELAMLALMVFEELAKQHEADSGVTVLGAIHENIVEARIAIGRSYALQRHKEALDQYAEAYNHVMTHCPRRLLLPILLQVGSVYRTMGDVDGAIARYLQALELARANQDRHLECRIHRELSVTYEAASRYREALEQFKAFSDMRNDLAVEHKRMSMEIARIQFNTEQRELEAALLREKNAMLENDLADFLMNAGQNTGQPEKTTSELETGTRSDDDSNVRRRRGKGTAIARQIYFRRSIEMMYPKFLIRLAEKVPALTPKETLVSGLIRIGFESDRIQKSLDVEVRTLEKHRSRIRRKSGCGPKENLAAYLARLTSDDADQ